MSNRRKTYKHPDYIAIYRHTFKSPAWQALSVGARAAYLELASNYNTKRMNAVYLPVRAGAERLGANKDTIVKWLRELQHYGFIVLVQGGSLGVQGYGLAQTFRLTDRPHGNTRATYDFQNWDGELFDPNPTGGRNWRPKKQNPVRREGTPRPTGRDIEKNGRASSLCPTGRDIETAANRPTGRDTTSLTSCKDLREPTAPEWTTPRLTELPWAAEVCRYCRLPASKYALTELRPDCYVHPECVEEYDAEHRKNALMA
jgi:hypothetical protein